MKHYRWTIPFMLILIVGLLLLAGCGVAQSDYDGLKADFDEAKARYEAAESELAQVREVYPLRDFPSLTALKDWLAENDVSEKPDTTYAEDWYGRALEVQEDAAVDGYIISADYDYSEEEEAYLVWGIAIINGKIFYWDPETDEVFEDDVLGTVK